MTAPQRLSAGTVSGGPFTAVIICFMMLLGGGAGLCAAGSDEGGASARAAYYELSIASENATKQIDLTSSVKTAAYRFQVRNTGDTSLPNCDLQLYPWTFPPEKWSYNFIPSAPFEVNPNDPPTTILLVIYPAADAEARRYTFQLQGKGSGVMSNSITINLDILQYADVLVKAPPPQDADPDTTLEYVFELVNTGNGKDEFVILSVEASVSGIAARLKDGNNRTGELGYKQSVNKTVVVVIPQGMKTTEGTAGFQLALLARSGFNSSQDDINWTLIRVNHTYDLSLDISPNSATLVPGQQAEFNVTVVNGGNGNDKITLNFTPQFDSLSWKVIPGQSSFSLVAGGNGTTVLKIIPPEQALPGSYYINISALCSGPSFPGPQGKIVILELEIPYARGLWAPRLDFIAPEPLAAGEAVSFSFNFTNIGNVEEAVEIAVYQKPAGWGAIIDVSGNLRLPPKMLQRVNLTVRAPPDRNESPPGKYFIKLRVSNADLSEVLNFTFEVTRRPFNDLDLVAVGPRDIALLPYIQAAHNFTFEVANAGDAVDIVRLTVGGDSSQWGTLQSGMISLGPGERRIVNLTVTVPVGTEGGRIYGLNLSAGSANGTGPFKTIGFSVAVVVVELRPAPGSFSALPRDPEVGTPVRLRVKVENLGSDPARNVTVTFLGPDMVPIGISHLPSISRGDGQVSVDLVWKIVSEGPNNITVVVDPDNRTPESDEGNNRLSMVVTGYLSDLVIDGAPVIQWAGKTVARVPLGSGVEVTVTVRNIGNYSLNLQSVEVVLSDRKTGEQDTFVINTLPASGRVNVTFKLAKPKLGTHVISIKVNPDGAVHEKNPDNNEKSGTFSVFEGGPGPTSPPIIVVAAVMVLVFVALVAAVMLRHRKR